MAQIRVSNGFLWWENFELLSDTMNSPTAEFPTWDSVPPCTLREAGTSLGQTSFVDDSIVLSCAMTDRSCKARIAVESTNLHGPANILLILGRTGSSPSGTEHRFDSVMLHSPLLLQTGI